VAVNECSQLNTSITIGMPFDISSDLDMGRGPELKSDEKSKGISIVIEIWYGVFYYFFGTRVHFIGASVHESVGTVRYSYSMNPWGPARACNGHRTIPVV
jgi:hypothetical protein